MNIWYIFILFRRTYNCIQASASCACMHVKGLEMIWDEEDGIGMHACNKNTKEDVIENKWKPKLQSFIYIYIYMEEP